MANDKRFVVKNGLATQNILFVDNIQSANNTVLIEMKPTNELVVATDEQALVVSNTPGSILTVNDSTGIPTIQVTDYGNILVGDLVDNGVDKIQASGSLFSETIKTSNLSFKTQQGADVISSELTSNTEVTFIGDSDDILSMGSDPNSSPFMINDFSGVPNIEVDVDGNVRLAQSFGLVLIGTIFGGKSKLRIVGLPTSSSGLSVGDVWNDNGTLKIIT